MMIDASIILAGCNQLLMRMTQHLSTVIYDRLQVIRGMHNVLSGILSQLFKAQHSNNNEINQ